MERLVFRLEEIPPEGLEFELTPDPGRYHINEAKVLNPPGISGWIKVVKERADLLVTGKLQATLEIPCKRCLKPAVHALGGEFCFRMVPREKMPREEEMELFGDEMEVEFFSGDEVDIRRIVAEQIYLNAPVGVLCRDDCRGLCPRCGQDLNIKACGHRPEKDDQRWQSLGKIKPGP